MKKKFFLLASMLTMTLCASAYDLYILGNINDNGTNFLPNQGIKMTEVSENAEWVIECTVNANVDGCGFFSFTKQLADSWNNMSNSNRIGPYSQDKPVDFNNTKEGGKMALGQIYSFKCPAGHYLLTVTKDPYWSEGYYLKIEVVDNSQDLYVIGQIDGHDWDPTNGNKLEWNNELGAYYGRIRTETNNCYFDFTTKLASANNNDGWSEIENNRIGMVSDGDWWLTEDRLGSSSAMIAKNAGGQSIWAQEAGTWDIIVNLSRKTLIINRVTPIYPEPVVTDLDVEASFDFMNNEATGDKATDGWAYDNNTKTITKIKRVQDPYGKIATFTFTATNPKWTPSTWKSDFTDKGLAYHKVPNPTSFTVKLDHVSDGNITHVFNTIAMKWMDTESNKKETIGNISVISNVSAGITQVIKQFGNEYTGNEIDGIQYDYDEVGIPEDYKTEITATYDKGDWGDHFAIQKITLRDDWTTSDIADVYGTHRGFKWRIMDPMVAVAYYGGTAYCRSIKDSRIERPKPAANQVPYYFIDYKDKDNPENGTWEQYTNYNWISLELTDQDAQEWNYGKAYIDDETIPAHQDFNSKAKDHVIKAGSIRGSYCDFIQNNHNLYVGFLNPHMILNENVTLTTETKETKRNKYDPYNLVCQKFVQHPDNWPTITGPYLDPAVANPYAQDSIFLMPPKRNEVCHIRDAVVDNNMAGYRGFWNRQIPYDDKTKCTLNSSNFVLDIKDDEVLKQIFSQEDIGYVHQLRNVVVRVASIEGQAYFGPEYYKPNGKSKVKSNRDDNDNAIHGVYYWPNYYEENVKYYGIVPRHSLVIEVRTGGKDFFRRGDNPFTTINEASVEKTPVTISFYNLAGQYSATPFEGFNVVVTQYSDGTTSSYKIMNPTK